MVWLVFFLPVVSAAVLPAGDQKEIENNNNNNEHRKLENGCDKNESSSWSCALIYGVNYLSTLIENLNGEEAKAIQDGEKLFDVFLNSSSVEGRTWRINRRNVVPLVVGVTFKFLSIIPLILGKLTLLGGIAIMVSKLSLFISLIMALKKFFGSGGFISLNPLGYHGHGGHYDGHHHHHHHGGHGGHRREMYIIRGRDIEEVNNAIEKYGNKGESDQKAIWIRRRMRKGPQVPRPDAESITNDPSESQEIRPVTENTS